MVNYKVNKSCKVNEVSKGGHKSYFIPPIRITSDHRLTANTN